MSQETYEREIIFRSSPKVLSISPNQGGDCFICGTDRGFSLFRTDPFQLLFEEEIKGGIQIAEMFYRTNIIALVGTGENKEYPKHKLVLFDHDKKKAIGEIKYGTEAILAVNMARDRIVVSKETDIRIYNLVKLKSLYSFSTCKNTKGLCCLSLETPYVFACPAIQEGHVRVELFHSQTTHILPCHKTQLACIAISRCGSFVATASYKGTLIRIWCTKDASLIQEVRRGIDPACITSLKFDYFSRLFLCTSDKNTLHIFEVKRQIGVVIPKETKETNNFVASVWQRVSTFFPSYFQLQGSVLHFTVGDNAMAIFGPGTNSVTIWSGKTITKVDLDSNFEQVSKSYQCMWGELTLL